MPTRTEIALTRPIAAPMPSKTHQKAKERVSRFILGWSHAVGAAAIAPHRVRYGIPLRAARGRWTHACRSARAMPRAGFGPPLRHDYDRERFGRAARRTRFCGLPQVEVRERESVPPCAGHRASAAPREDCWTPSLADRRWGPPRCAASPGTPQSARSPAGNHRQVVGLNAPMKATRHHGPIEPCSPEPGRPEAFIASVKHVVFVALGLFATMSPSKRDVDGSSLARPRCVDLPLPGTPVTTSAPATPFRAPGISACGRPSSLHAAQKW